MPQVVEPEYLAQTGEQMNDKERFAWIRARSREASEEGCVFFRASISDDNRLTLVEGWKTEIKGGADQGEPRFQYSAPEEPSQ